MMVMLQIIELDEMQNEKRKQLLEKERNTMKEHESKYHEMRELWQENLIARKTVSKKGLGHWHESC